MSYSSIPIQEDRSLANRASCWYRKRTLQTATARQLRRADTDEQRRGRLLEVVHAAKLTRGLGRFSRRGRRKRRRRAQGDQETSCRGS
jgi:hypothetical protein